jgi:hypothetical protein
MQLFSQPRVKRMTVALDFILLLLLLPLLLKMKMKKSPNSSWVCAS